MRGKKKEGVVIKLGGSVITPKGSGRQVVRKEVVLRIGKEIVETGIQRVVIVHGAGSFGHTVVNKTGINKGIKGRKGLVDWSSAQLVQNKLNVMVTEILLQAGIPAFAFQPTGIVVLKAGKIQRLEKFVLEELVSLGLVPVLYGIPAYDRERKCTILSGDTIAPVIAEILGIDYVVYATDVDGVYDSDPKINPCAKRIPVINRENWKKIEKLVGGSACVDVTGGMKGKIKEMIEWARKGVKARIVNALIPGRISKAIKGENVGTFIRW